MSYLKSTLAFKQRNIFGSLRFLSGYQKRIFSQPMIKSCRKRTSLPQPSNNRKCQEGNGSKSKYHYLLMFSLPFFQKQEETEDNTLFMKIKGGLMAIEEKEYALAERKLHVALKYARDEKLVNGANYIFSILANLAFIIEDYNKAELLYVDLLQKLIALEYDYDSNSVMHVSLKLSMIYEYTDQYEKALAGYDFCTDKLKEKVDKGELNIDGLTIYGMAQEAYGNFLIRGGLFDEAMDRLKTAFDICVKLKGPKDAQTAVLLNSLCKVAIFKENYQEAEVYLNNACDIASEISEPSLPIYLVNLAKLKLLQSMPLAAKVCCVNASQLVNSNEELNKHVEDCFSAVQEYKNNLSH